MQFFFFYQNYDSGIGQGPFLESHGTLCVMVPAPESLRDGSITIVS